MATEDFNPLPLPTSSPGRSARGAGSFKLKSGSPRMDIFLDIRQPLHERATLFVTELNRGLHSHPPELCEDGLGGTYFLRNLNGEIICVFKPAEEEPWSRGNPKKVSLASSGEQRLLAGFAAGEGYLREVAAHLLDHGSWAGVPLTYAVHFNFDARVQNASIQQFVPHVDTASAFGPSRYSTRDVQAIAALDIRILNCDRHEDNLLVDEQMHLVPIDHGFCLGENLREVLFSWLHWPQVKEPILPEVKEYISQLDIEEDIRILTLLQFKPPVLRLARIAHALLLAAIDLGLTLFDIAAAISLDFNDPSSTTLLEECSQSCPEEPPFRDSVRNITQLYITSRKPISLP